MWVFSSVHVVRIDGYLYKWYFITKIVLTYCEKKCSSDREKLSKFEAEGQEFAKFSRCERSEEFLVNFFNLFLEFLNP